MKKLGIGLLAAALSLPFAFAATQPKSSTTQTTKTTTKKHVKKHHAKKAKGMQSKATKK
jgi:hypothetical protein